MTMITSLYKRRSNDLWGIILPSMIHMAYDPPGGLTGDDSQLVIM